MEALIIDLDGVDSVIFWTEFVIRNPMCTAMALCYGTKTPKNTMHEVEAREESKGYKDKNSIVLDIQSHNFFKDT